MAHTINGMAHEGTKQNRLLKHFDGDKEAFEVIRTNVLLEHTGDPNTGRALNWSGFQMAFESFCCVMPFDYQRLKCLDFR